MSEIGLTQEQIDALLGSGSSGGSDSGGGSGPGGGGGFNPGDFRLLEDFERQAMGNLPSVVNAMTGFEYALKDIEYTEAAIAELPALIADSLVFALPIAAAASYIHYVSVEQAFAKSVSAALTGGEPQQGAELTEMEQSAIGEVVSQINGSYLTNLSSALDMPTHGESVTLGDAASINPEGQETVLLGCIRLQQGSDEAAIVWHVLPLALGKLILDKIAPKAAPAPAVPTRAAAPPAPPAAPQRPSAPANAPAGQSVYGATQSIFGSAPPAASAAPVDYAPAQFSQFAPQQLTPAEQHNLDLLLDVPLQVTVELGKTSIPIKLILDYGQGSLITLDKLAGEPIDLLVNGHYFAKGEVVVIDENFGVRITSILSPAERLGQLA